MRSEKIASPPATETRGRTIPWAGFYDAVVWLLSLGKGADIRQATVELARIEPGDRLLDVGCGTGDLTLAAKALAGPGGEVVGTDASPEMIDAARRKAARAGLKVTFQVDLVEKMSFPDDRFDVVLSSLMMHHLPDDLKRQGLSEIYRVLRPGGRLLVVDLESSTGGSVVQRFSDVMIQLHGGHTAMQDNVKKLSPFLEAAGFTGLESGKLNRQLSFISGRKAAAS